MMYLMYAVLIILLSRALSSFVAFLYWPTMVCYLLFTDCHVGGQEKTLEILNKLYIREKSRVYCCSLEKVALVVPCSHCMKLMSSLISFAHFDANIF